jgi:hypothetical protein
MKKVFAIAAVFAAMVMAFTGPAMADVFFTGTGPSGVDTYGHPWSWQLNLAGTASAWGSPGLGLATFTWAGPPTGDFYVDFDVLPAGVTIDQTAPSGPLGYEETTRFSNVSAMSGAGALWTITQVSADDIHFVAPAGAALMPGNQFFYNIVFTGLVDPTTVGFVASYSPAVPLPSAFMLLGPGLLGLVGLRRRFKK